MDLTCEQSLSKLTFNLIKGRPFYGNVLLRLRDASESSAVDTAGATATQIVFNKDFMDGLSNAEKNFVWLHELYHIVLMHPSREGNRIHEIWNAAADFIVNYNLEADKEDLKSVGIDIQELPKALIAKSEDVSEFSTEMLYKELYTQFSAQGGDQKLLGTYGFTVGDFKFSMSIVNDDLLSGSVSPEESARIKEVLAASKSSYGGGKGGLFRELEGLIGTKIPWYRYIRRYLTSLQDDEESFDTPNKNFLWEKRILPGPGSFDREVLYDTIVAIDTSASITQIMLEDFMYQIKTLILDFDLSGKIIFWDAEVESEVSITEDSKKISKPKGGGGTNFNPVLEYINKKYAGASLLLVLTDGYFPDITVKPKMKVVWALSNGGSSESLAKIGKVVYID